MSGTAAKGFTLPLFQLFSVSAALCTGRVMILRTAKLGN